MKIFIVLSKKKVSPFNSLNNPHKLSYFIINSASVTQLPRPNNPTLPQQNKPLALRLTPHTVFAWQAYEKGTDVHLQADPTKLAVLANQFKKNKAAYKEDIRDGILQKYGGQEHLDAPPKELLLAQTVSAGVMYGVQISLKLLITSNSLVDRGSSNIIQCKVVDTNTII